MKNAKPVTTARIALGAAAGLLVAVVLSLIAKHYGNESFSTGLLSGGIGGVSAVVILLVLSRTRFATAEARLTAGRADERERQVALRSAALAGGLMYAVTVVVVLLNGIGVEAGIVGYTIIMFAGLIAASASYIVGVRRP